MTEKIYPGWYTDTSKVSFDDRKPFWVVGRMPSGTFVILVETIQGASFRFFSSGDERYLKKVDPNDYW